ncbi:MAG: hypothetical protein CL484_08500 [Acidobacteria bacterium]|nr:hypothetical protein [Acidobacteriota bacterium]|tara:strand:- start:74 stop:1165 length:1092 start_codon:yes stop_codon:yes gene_type:complete
MGTRVTVLGGGNTAFAVAARLSHKGHEVCLLEHPDFSHTVTEITQNKEITLEGVLETGPVRLTRITTDPREALTFSPLLLLIVPSYAHRPFANLCGPHLTADHTIVLMPGNLGSMEFLTLARTFGISGFTVAEVDTAPYVCRKTSDTSAVIWGEVTSLGLGVLPASETTSVAQILRSLFANIAPYRDVAECGLSSMNPVVHPAGVLMNAGRVEYSRGEFYFYEEGVSNSVAKVIEAVDLERQAVGSALGYQLTPVGEAFYNAGFGPRGSIWETINGSHMLTRLKAPGSLESRWLTEDIPYGIATWSKLGSQFNVDTPVTDALVHIGSIVMEADGWGIGRGPTELGIAGMSKHALRRYLDTGRS